MPSKKNKPRNRGIDSVRQTLEAFGRVGMLKPAEEIELGKLVRAWQELEERRSLLSETHGKLTDSQFCELAQIPESFYQEAKSKGLVSRRKMVAANMRLVVAIAKRYSDGDEETLLELIQEGAIGLQRGIEKFEPGRGNKLSTYVYWWIRQGISRSRPNLNRLIRIPVHLTEKYNRVQKARNKLQRKLGRSPTVAEMANELGVSQQYVREIDVYTQFPLSLDTPRGEEKDTSLLDVVADGNGAEPDNHAAIAHQKEAVLSLFADSSLSDREVEILKLRFGFVDGQIYTLRQIGTIQGLSCERVRQIQNKAMRKLRKPQFLARHGISEDLIGLCG